MNDRSDWLEGNYIYERAFAGAVFDPNSPDADVALTFLWRSGRWSEARKLLDQQGGWHRPELSQQLMKDRRNAVCRLELAAEFDFDHCTQTLREETSVGRLVADFVTEPPTLGLAGAGSRFAVHRAAVPLRPDRALSPAAAAIERWQAADAAQPAAGDAISALNVTVLGLDRITARTGPVGASRPSSPVIEARSLAVLTPYADLVGTMRQLPAHQYLVDYAAAVRESLNELGNLAPLGSPPWRDYVDTPPTLALQSLTELGLLAELIGAAAYVRGDRDLNLVARCAERWRRTVAGSWSYGTAAKPAGWDGAIDVTIVDRMSVMVVESDAFARATAQLQAWCPEQPDVLGLLRKRAPATVEAATRAAADGTVADAAAVLLTRNIPSAFVPGIAVLIGHSGRPSQLTQPTIQYRPEQGTQR
jgi:hypothetical protein